MRELPAGRDALLLDFTDEPDPAVAVRKAHAVLSGAVAAGSPSGVIDVVRADVTVLVQAESGHGLDQLGVHRALRGVDLADDTSPVFTRVEPPSSPATAEAGDLVVIEPGPLTTIQDLGRPGHADGGASLAGAADRGAHRLANRLVGNDEGAAGLELTLGGLRLRARRRLLIAVTGAPADARIDGVDHGHHSATTVPAGAELYVPPPKTGLRTYVAVRGGIDIAPVLGSRSTDVRTGLGPSPLRAGDELAIGPSPGPWPVVTEAPWDVPAPDRPVTLRTAVGPRADHVVDPAALFTGQWSVEASSDRVGIGLRGDLLRYSTSARRLRPEGIALGSVQLTPSGQPVVAMADHPRIGDHPVIAVITAESVDAAAQLRPGRTVRFVAG